MSGRTCRSRIRSRVQVTASLAMGALIVSIVAAAAAVRPTSGDSNPADLLAPRDVIWSQTYNAPGSKISSEAIPEYSVDSEVANDFTYASSTTVTRVSWWGGPYRSTDATTIGMFDVFFYDDDGTCRPGSSGKSYWYLEPTRTQVATDGRGFPIYKYDAYVNVPITGGKTYWVTIQAYNHDSPPQWGRQQASSMMGCGPSMIRSDYFGHPDWTSCSTIAGSPWDASVEISINTPTTQACCFPGGTCQMLLADSCAIAGGTAQGAGTDCVTTSCPQPTQACCAPAGTCAMSTALDCYISGGSPLGTGTTCTPNPCTAQQACCMADGTCEMLVPAYCTMILGVPQGPTGVCSPNPCPAAEACCFADGVCELYVTTVCALFGGTSHGVGTTCTPDNPCPQPPAEACCFEDGHCEMQVPLECDSRGGTNQGTGTACTPTNPCQQPENQACCFSDGHCTFVLPADCVTATGNPGGTGTTCSPNICPLVIPVERSSWGKLKALYR